MLCKLLVSKLFLEIFTTRNIYGVCVWNSILVLSTRAKHFRLAFNMTLVTLSLLVAVVIVELVVVLFVLVLQAEIGLTYKPAVHIS